MLPIANQSIQNTLKQREERRKTKREEEKGRTTQKKTEVQLETQRAHGNVA